MPKLSEINDDGEILFRSLADASEELRALWQICSTHPALLSEQVVLTTDVRCYSDGPVFELYVDCEAKSGKAFAWCADVRVRDQMWTVERTVRMNDLEGQHVLIELTFQAFSSSRLLALELPLLIKKLVGTFSQVDLAAA